MDLELKGKIALVTGASKGIGLACAAALAREGAVVVGVSRSEANLAQARASLAAQGLEMHAVVADLVDSAAAARLVDEAWARFGAIDVLVNSAGAARRYAPDELEPAAFRQAMDAKYFSYVHVMEPVARRMAARGQGSIVNVIGQGGRQAGVMHIAGGAANSALMLATVGLARAYAGKGVRVNAVNPGLTRTSRIDEGLEASARTSGRSREALLEDELARIPMGRLAEPAEIADAVAWLASGRASYVSGAIVPMDGCTVSVI
ncbi:SDR family NAD(P)-dependent oxidoreductase [Quisquiliibacterium transsilvanicum]|uniref:NAD(P)-dependent dehydrogenase (Short-subunit alcohol dehydrogenase family) n=1 Tax=Quisquiliibacterium transsilvanicum TaxID=1549638 RepID=A0A7W8HFG7_9BURK|nr:SDR family oxidoreductase [Quisquiliibacterium transsilvanicum]MBB5271144.1 NAD(P)-dependent dehydrogenase (short-subunit alcohol dehydrogenase family) [Quisquiliibacterium transsilvanicum]